MQRAVHTPPGPVRGRLPAPSERSRGAIPITLAAVLALVGAACGDDVTPSPEDETYPIPDERPPNETCFAPAPAPGGDYQVTRVFDGAFDGVSVRQATQLVPHPTRDDRWYLSRQSGRVLVFDADVETGEATSGAETVIDIAHQLWTDWHEAGLVSLALHPDFDSNGYIYLSFTIPIDDSTVGGGVFASRVARFTVGDDGTADASSRLVILDIPQNRGAHSGNHVAFGPDGYLYYAVGDDFTWQRNPPYAQDTFTLGGSILRLDVDVDDPNTIGAYGIPPDNVFADGEGGRPEIYAFGFRNPWRFTWDRETGDLYVGDVGQDTLEELSLVEPGGNHGWPIFEGSRCFLETPCDGTGLVGPVAEYLNFGGASITAGFVYRGQTLDELTGRPIWADFISGEVFSLSTDEQGRPLSKTELESGFNIVSFAEDHTGELYVVRYSVEDGGGIYRLDRAAEPDESTFPELLSQTGCLDPNDPRLPASGVIPYEVRAALWSDGAVKERFLAIPMDRRLAVDERGDMLFPAGTVLIKHFIIDERYVETRLLVRYEDEWAGYSYAWNEEQTDAALLDSSQTRFVDDDTEWTYPSRSDCLRCHTEATNRVLGPEVGQLRWDAPGDDVEGDQVDYLFGLGMFVPIFEAVEDLPLYADGPVLVDPYGDAPIEQRAKSYLHANCAGCHQPGGPGRGVIDLRYTTPFADMNLCEEEPSQGRLYWPSELQWLVTPGDSFASVLHRRMVNLDVFHMPPLATAEIDEQGVALIEAWIDSLEGCP